MGHKHEIDIYELINKSEGMPDGEKLSLYQTKLERYACMLDLIQGEYEKAYLELRRANGLTVISDTIFNEDIPEGARPAMASTETLVSESVTEEEPTFDIANDTVEVSESMSVNESSTEIEIPAEIPAEEIATDIMTEAVPVDMVAEPEPVTEPTIAEQAESILESIDAIIPAETIESEIASKETPATDISDVSSIPITEEIAELAAEIAEPEMPVITEVASVIEPDVSAVPVPDLAVTPEVVAAVAEPEVSVMPEVADTIANSEVPVMPEVSAAIEPDASAAPMPDLSALEGMEMDPAMIAQAFEQATAQA